MYRKGLTRTTSWVRQVSGRGFPTFMGRFAWRLLHSILSSQSQQMGRVSTGIILWQRMCACDHQKQVHCRLQGLAKTRKTKLEDAVGKSFHTVTNELPYWEIRHLLLSFIFIILLRESFCFRLEPYTKAFTTTWQLFFRIDPRHRSRALPVLVCIIWNCFIAYGPLTLSLAIRCKITTMW